MAPLPIAFELLSDDVLMDNVATRHNFNESPLIRLPAELRAKIWIMCLSNAHIRLSGHVRQHKSRDLEVRVRRLDERLGFVFDLSTYRGNGGCASKNTAVPTTKESITLTHHVSYDTTMSCPAHPISNAKFSYRLPALWRVCKLLYNETYDIPFAAGNRFHFKDFPTLMLIHKYDTPLLGRIVRLSLDRYDEKELKRLLQFRKYRSSNPVLADNELCHRKSNLQRVLPALKELWLEGQLEYWVSAAKRSQGQNQGFYESMLQEEKDRVSRTVAFWKPLVSKVIIEELPTCATTR